MLYVFHSLKAVLEVTIICTVKTVNKAPELTFTLQLINFKIIL